MSLSLGREAYHIPLVPTIWGDGDCIDEETGRLFMCSDPTSPSDTRISFEDLKTIRNLLSKREGYVLNVECLERQQWDDEFYTQPQWVICPRGFLRENEAVAWDPASDMEDSDRLTYQFGAKISYATLCDIIVFAEEQNALGISIYAYSDPSNFKTTEDPDVTHIVVRPLMGLSLTNESANERWFNCEV